MVLLSRTAVLAAQGAFVATCFLQGSADAADLVQDTSDEAKALRDRFWTFYSEDKWAESLREAGATGKGVITERRAHVKDTIDRFIRPGTPTDRDVQNLFNNVNAVLDEEATTEATDFVPAALKDYTHVVLGAKVVQDGDTPGDLPHLLATELHRANVKKLLTISSAAAAVSGGTQSHGGEYVHVECDLLSKSKCFAENLKLGIEKVIIWFTFGNFVTDLAGFRDNLFVATTVKSAIKENPKWIVAFTSIDAGSPQLSDKDDRRSAVLKLTQLAVLRSTAGVAAQVQYCPKEINEAMQGVSIDTKVAEGVCSIWQGENQRQWDAFKAAATVDTSQTPRSNVMEVEGLTPMASGMSIQRALSQVDSLDPDGKFRGFLIPASWVMKRLPRMISIKTAAGMHLQQMSKFVGSLPPITYADDTVTAGGPSGTGKTGNKPITNAGSPPGTTGNEPITNEPTDPAEKNTGNKKTTVPAKAAEVTAGNNMGPVLWTVVLLILVVVVALAVLLCMPTPRDVQAPEGEMELHAFSAESIPCEEAFRP